VRAIAHGSKVDWSSILARGGANEAASHHGLPPAVHLPKARRAVLGRQVRHVLHSRILVLQVIIEVLVLVVNLVGEAGGLETTIHDHGRVAIMRRLRLIDIVAGNRIADPLEIGAPLRALESFILGSGLIAKLAGGRQTTIEL